MATAGVRAALTPSGPQRRGGRGPVSATFGATVGRESRSRSVEQASLRLHTSDVEELLEVRDAGTGHPYAGIAPCRVLLAAVDVLLADVETAAVSDLGVDHVILRWLR